MDEDEINVNIFDIIDESWDNSHHDDDWSPEDFQDFDPYDDMPYSDKF